MNGWKKIKSEIVHKNPWFYIRRDQVIRPDGKDGEYYYFDGHHGVGIIAEDDDGMIYLAGGNKYPIGNKFSWGVICEGMEEGETFLETAKRGLKEEAGLEADDWQEIGYFYTLESFSSEKAVVYVARKLRKVKTTHKDNDEFLAIRKETVDNVIKMIENNEISSGYIIACLYKYLMFKNKKI